MSQTQDILEKPVGVLERGLILLQCFSQDRTNIRLKEFAAITSFNKATILRALNVLQDYNFIVQNADGSYSPSFELERLGILYRQNYPSMVRIQDILDIISHDIKESAAFYIPEGNMRICVATSNAQRSIQHNFYVGKQIPIAEGGSASHIIAHFTDPKAKANTDISKNGYAFTISERESEQASISIGLFNLKREFLGAIVVAGLYTRFNDACCNRIINTAKKAIENKGFLSSI